MDFAPFIHAHFFKRLVATLVLAAGPALSASGSVPLAGTVVEGSSVPGIALGATRAGVGVAYGPPSFCQGPVQDFCTYTLAGTGSVNVRYRGSDGGAAAGTGADVLYNVSWSGYPQWVTTAGVTTALALSDPDAVTNAYPNGSVTYNFQNNIFRVSDPGSGIQVQWNYNLYAGTVDTSISVFAASRPQPPRLAIEPAPDNSITLHWPESAVNMILESTPNASLDGGWEPVTVPTPVVSDGEFILTLPKADEARFFRLVSAP